MSRDMRRVWGRLLTAGRAGQRREQRARLCRLLLVPDLLGDPQCLSQRGPRGGLAAGFRLGRAEAHQCPGLAAPVTGGAVPGKRFLLLGDRFIKAPLLHVDAPKIVQRVSFRVAANLAANVECLQIVVGGRVKITELEVNLAEIVQRDAAQ